MSCALDGKLTPATGYVVFIASLLSLLANSGFEILLVPITLALGFIYLIYYLLFHKNVTKVWKVVTSVVLTFILIYVYTQWIEWQ